MGWLKFCKKPLDLLADKYYNVFSGRQKEVIK